MLLSMFFNDGSLGYEGYYFFYKLLIEFYTEIRECEFFIDFLLFKETLSSCPKNEF